LSRAHQVLGDAVYLNEALRTASFLKANLWDATQQRLKRRYRQGEAGIDGFLADYAMVVQGLIDLYEASLDDQWLLWAVELTRVQESLFTDPAGGFFTAGDQDSSLLVRMKDDYDGALPAANSVALSNLVRLAQMTGQRRWQDQARKGFQAFGARLEQGPQGLPLMLVALGFDHGSPHQVLLAGDRDAADTRALLKEVHHRFLPHRVILLADGGRWQQQYASDLPVLESLVRIDGKATAYVCRDYVCDLPTNDPRVLAALLSSKSLRSQ